MSDTLISLILKGLGDNSEILSIKIEYDDTITSSHPFPDSFWIVLQSSKTGIPSKLEFEKSNYVETGKPVNIWINDPQSDSTFSLHEDSEWDKVRSKHFSS